LELTSANGSDTLTDFDSGLNRSPLLAPAPSVNAAAFIEIWRHGLAARLR
jgi:hypothetical protein